MWKNFSTSVGLLAIALMAALYSSTATQNGRMLPSAISAFIALAISAWVAWKFVPRLAAGVDWRWLPFLTHYHVTREGWLYFGAVTVVVFSSVNTANNLLYMILSALLAVLVLSGTLSALNFRSLEMSMRIPSHCFAREPFPVSLQVHNRKRVFPTFSLHIGTMDESAFRCSDFYVPLVRPQKSTSDTGQAMLTKRGRHTLSKLKVSTRYPFGFFVKDLSYAVGAECICYPEIIPQEQINLSVRDVHGSNHRFERGFGHDIYMIRDYIPSDTARHVHWKASAKTSVLKTREYAAEENQRIVLAFDRFGHPGDIEKFEQLVSYTASLAYHFVQNGVDVALVSDDWQSSYGNTSSVLDSIFEYLALVQSSSAADSPGLGAADGAIALSLRN
ncbi:MAG: hypothetical protein DMG16_23405 [Acidobacteria bacterium]|nr:MAG: hypothetical protein DMG16_23405 [Acidobacteriota bacterium]